VRNSLSSGGKFNKLKAGHIDGVNEQKMFIKISELNFGNSAAIRNSSEYRARSEKVFIFKSKVIMLSVKFVQIEVVLVELHSQTNPLVELHTPINPMGLL
jgi:hypothetical protein